MPDEDDEDWFESAFEDEDAEESESASAERRERESESDAGDPDAGPTESDAEAGESAAGADEQAAGAGEPEPESEGSEPPEEAGMDVPGEQPTEDDFADAFGAGEQSPGDGGEQAPEAGDGEESGGGGDLFDDDFADAFGGGGGGGGEQLPEMGGGGGGGEAFGFDLEGGTGADTGGFEEEEYDSDIPRIDVGIEGLDEMIQGGLPERSLMVALGEAGTGKTTFGLQFLHEAIENGERAVFITLEESRERVVQSATDKGWEFERHVEEGNLAVVDIDPIEMANSLTSIRNELPRLVEEFGASRLVLDSVSLLEMMYDDQSKRRTEIYDFTKSLKEAGVTTMLTSEASEDNPFASRYGIIEYLTDAVVVLRYIRPEDFRETRLAVEIQKIRDA
ncbi:MAG: KaiC domain-containing protein, partial [Halobacterium sp.]